MSKNKGFSDTSANRYSLALYELAKDSNSLVNVEINAKAFLNLISNNKDFKNFIKDPTLNREVLTSVINKISDNFKLEILFKNFVNFLVLKRRFFYLEQILKTFIEICSEKRGELKAEIKSAKELNTKDISKVKEELAENFGSNIKLNYKHDPSLIGGLVIKVGSTMVDTSIKNKLHQIQKQMIEA